jgi:hypothetical protein
MVVWRLRYHDIGLLLMSPLVRYLQTNRRPGWRQRVLRLGMATEADVPQRERQNFPAAL